MIWLGWFLTGLVMIGLGIWLEDVFILGTVIGSIAEWGWIPATIIAITLSVMVEMCADDARKRANGTGI
ncbi:hypothetical protein [Streptomyces sp. NPDC056663]|uniref:hypothetical protein n=1 Tax=Streptomyces sp. NPDC056663 TaxID=3345899 RepID=UPI0036B60ACB